MTSNYKKIVFTIFSIVSIIGYGYFVYAAAPLGGYTAGQTLDPDCAPGDTDCVVAITSGGGVPAGSNGQVQYNNNGVFGADNLFTRDPSTFNTFIGKDITTPLYEYIIDLGYYIADHPYTGTFVLGEIVTGDTSGATAVIQRIDTPILITSVSGIFQDGETITGQTSGATTLGNNILSIQPGDTVMIFDLDPITYRSVGTVISTTSTQATIQTTGILQVDDYIGTIFEGTFTDSANSVAGIISQSQIGTVDGSSNLSIGNSVDILGGLLTGTGSVLSSKSSPDREAQLFLGNSNTLGWNDAFVLSSTDTSADLGATIFGNTNSLAGTSTLQIGVGDVSSSGSVPSSSISLERNYTSSFISFDTDMGRIGYFKNNGSVGLGFESNPDGDNSFTIGYGVRSQSFGETTLGLWNTSSGTVLSTTAFDSFDRILTVGNGTDLGFQHNAYTMWKDGSFAYNDDNFQNDNSGTEQNMFYFNYGNHDGLGVAQTNKSVRLGSACDDIWDVNSGNVGDRSIAIGFALSGCAADGPTASGNNSLAIGRSTIASNQDALAIGTNAQATGEQSVAIGQSSFATGRYSIVIGSSTSSSAEGSISIGGYHDSSGIYSAAIGRGNTASGDYSTALGKDTISSGDNSFVAGNGSIASGDNSFAFGLGNSALSFGEVVFGLGSTPYTPVDANSFASADRLFTIGSGDGVISSDAFTILKNGQTGVHIDNFEANSNGSVFQVGNGMTTIAYVDNGTGNWVAVSDARQKHNIEDLTYGLDEIMQLRPVSFDYNRNDEHTIGFLAQEVKDIIPEAVFGDEDKGYGMSYQVLTPALLNAIKEMNLKITDIGNMNTPNTWRDALIGWFESATNGIRKLFVGEVHTDTLCIGQTCVTESQLQQLLQNSPQVIYSTPDDNPPTEPDPETSDEPPVPELESNPGINEESPAPDVTDNAPTE